jgi:hypothetical protein
MAASADGCKRLLCRPPNECGTVFLSDVTDALEITTLVAKRYCHRYGPVQNLPLVIEVAEMLRPARTRIRAIRDYKPARNQQFKNPSEEFTAEPENPARAFAVHGVVASKEEHAELG